MNRRNFIKTGLIFVPIAAKAQGLIVNPYRFSSGGTPARTDDFNRANAATLGANWTNQTANTPSVSSNQCVATASNHHCAYWSANAFNNNQYAKAVVKAVSSGVSYCGVTVRSTGNGGTTNNYHFLTDGAGGSGHTAIGKFENNVQSFILNISTTFAVNDVIELRVSGTTVSAYKNGAFLDSVVDTSHASGSAGVHVFGSAQQDDWEGGNL